jgi:drug/metabolite transporter (DMT)-like permease
LKTKTAPFLALLLLCLLWAAASLRSDLLPGSTASGSSSSVVRQAIPLALLAGIMAVAAFVRKASWPRGSVLGSTILAGIGLFAAPSLLIEIAKGNIDDITRVALFSLTPVFAVVFEPYLGTGSTSQQRGGLAASLTAVCGTLLVFPFNVPQSGVAVLAVSGILAAVASVAAANCLCVRLVCEQPAPSALSFAAVAAGSAAVALVAWSALFQRPTWTSPRVDVWTGFDLLTLVLLFWLLRRMTAVRMTTRFLIAPLLANLAGLAFLHPGVQARGWLGLLLIAAGSGWLLFGPEDEPERTGSSLGINQR